MPRYVLGDAWWEIERDGTCNIVRAGSASEPVKEQLRRYKTAGHAEIQYDVMIRDKVAAGYELTTAPAPAIAAHEPPAAMGDLETAIAADPYGTSVYAVYGDSLQAAGDPRGELIALQLAEDAKPGDAKLVAAIGRLLEKHRAHLFGPLAKHAGKLREFSEGAFIWRFGFIHIAQLDRQELTDPLAPIVRDLLHHPSGRFVAELLLRDDDERDLAELLELLATGEPLSLRALELTTAADVGDLGGVLRAHPKLRRLAVRGRVGSDAVTPIRTTLRSIVAAALPELEELELRLVNRDARVPDVRALLRRTDLPALRRLRLRSADFPNEILADLVESPFASQLELVDLSLCEIGDRAIGGLVDRRARFPNLREVVLTRGHLSRTMLARLEDMVKKVSFADDDPDDEGRLDDADYYDEVTE
ncbi:MAG TPA: hypothetical protein VFQ53_14170 [Kofleriaceae bacterium]|nr:hypothetical protein [Kofleriaceae bacterium]